MEGVSFFSYDADSDELLNEIEKLIVSVLKLRNVGDIIEVAKVGMNHPHKDHWVEGNVYFECLRVFVPEFNEPVQRQPLLIAFFRSPHGLVNLLFLLIAKMSLCKKMIT